MSVEKVNSYKESKANRKADLEKARKKKIRDKVIGWAIVCVVLGGLAVALVITGINMGKAYVAGLPDYTANSITIDKYIEHTTEAESEEATSEEATSEEETSAAN